MGTPCGSTVYGRTGGGSTPDIQDDLSRPSSFLELTHDPRRSSGEASPKLTGVRVFRRGLLVAVLAVLAGLGIRLWGRGSVPTSSGGWRELEGPDFR
jgi:hypothetical protein